MSKTNDGRLPPEVDDYTLDAILEEGEGEGKPITLANTAAFLRLMARQCKPWHWVREFTMNALEAKGVDHVQWDVDWNHVEECVRQGKPPVYRATIWNTGCGMTEAELVKYIGALSSSSKTMDVRDHHGMGARVSAAWHNKKGIVWMSWVDGVGSMVCLKLLADGNFGLKSFDYDDGMREVFAATPEEYNHLPDGTPRTNGTLVIFLGDSEDQHTWLGITPEDRYEGKCYAKFLNKRFGRLPEGVTVEAWESPGKKKNRKDVDPVRDNWPTKRPNRSHADDEDLDDNEDLDDENLDDDEDLDEDLDDNDENLDDIVDILDAIDENTPAGKKKGKKKGSNFRRARGAMYYFENFKQKKYLLHNSTLTFSAAEAGVPILMHVFVFSDEENEKGKLRCWNMNSYAYTPSNVLAMWNDEVYAADKSDGRQRQFGLISKKVAKRVAIVVEIMPEADVYPDPGRSRLCLPGTKDLPWGLWGSLFKLNMPKVIQDLLVEVQPKDIDVDQLLQSIRDGLLALYEQSGRKPDCGPGNGSGVIGGPGNVPGPGAGGNGGVGTQPRGTGTRVRRPGGRQNPHGKGVQGSGPSRIAPPGVEVHFDNEDPNRPASYSLYDGTLSIYIRHFIFQRIRKTLQEAFGDAPGWTDSYMDTQLVYHIAMHLGYMVMHALELKSSYYKKSWSDDEVEDVFNESSLTLACMAKEIEDKVHADCKRKFGVSAISVSVTVAAAK